ncbi:MAG TPA: hypothetical protein VK158_03365 [Acidobacteriota bacterium]|nr:hypothetical protein [Acidobacteriota bacterium]
MKPQYFHFKNKDRDIARLVEMPDRAQYATIVSNHVTSLYSQLPAKSFGEIGDKQAFIKEDLASFLAGEKLFKHIRDVRVFLHQNTELTERIVGETSVRAFVVASPQVNLDLVYSHISQWQQHMINHTYERGRQLMSDFARRGVHFDDVALALTVKPQPKIKIRSHVESDLRAGNRTCVYVLCQEYIPGEHSPDAGPVEMHHTPIFEFHAHCSPIVLQR